MNAFQKIRSIRFEYQISFIYLILGLSWILFSDRVSESLTNDPELLSHIQTYKGSFYIIITAILLFFLVRSHLNRIKEQQLLIETMFNAISDNVIITNITGEILMVNRSTVITFARSPKDLIGKSTNSFFNSQDDFKQVINSRVNLQSHSVKINDTFLYRDVNDKIFPGETFMARLTDSNNNWIGNLIIIRDISERKRFIEEIERGKQKAEESDKLKTAFLQNISHEIRTPMNAIIGFTDLIISPELSAEQLNRYKKIIINSSRQLLSVVNDILTISSLETHQVQVNILPVDIHNILSELWTIFNEEALKKGITLLNHCENKATIILDTDETKFRQVISNLLSNAIKFTQNGLVDFGYDIKDSWIEFYVRDTGIGIKPEVYSHIFERFRQADIAMAKKYGGTGLGLSISKEFVEILGGKIWVDSVEGKGSVFYFTLPLNVSMKSIQESASPEFELNYPALLVVEDEEFNFLFIEALLKKWKIKLFHAWNGKEAIDIYQNNPEIMLVIMDLKMPVMDGYEATRNLKKINPVIPVIAHTAYAMPKDITDAQKYGFDAYVTKPVKSSQLKEIIGKYLTSVNR